MHRWLLIAAALFVCACDRGADVPEPPAQPAVVQDSIPASITPADTTPPPAVQLIDSLIPQAVAGEDGWNYHRTAEVDLDGDGEAERVVLTARVELYRGRPAWDDGQPWQVYVQESDGRRTYVYARRLQLGSLTMRIAQPTDGGTPTIVLLEHLPDRMSVYEATYSATGDVTTLVRFERELDPRGETASPQLP